MKKTTISILIAIAAIGTLSYFTLASDTTPTITSALTQTTTSNTVTTAQTNTSVVADTTLSKTTTITEGGTHTLTGTITDGQIVIDAGDEDITLILNGVDITNSSGAALYIKSAGDVTIELADGSTNLLTQTGLDGDEEEKAALYSTSDLEIVGNTTASLIVESTVADGISGNDDLYLTTANITVTAADDGIRGKDSVNISGGVITVDAGDDGIKTTNSEELGRGVLTIYDGTITVTAGDDAIKAEQAIVIEGGTINIPTSGEGIEAPVVTINDGDITIYATDDGINAATSDIITSGLVITINGGNLTIEVGPGDTDAIDSNGDLYVNGGTINITAQMSSFDYDGSGAINGGTVTVNGQTITTMPTQMMGGGMGGGRMRPGTMQ